MTYKFSIDLNGHQTDEITLQSLKEAYEDCIKTMTNPDMQVFDPLEDVLARHQALMKVLQYYSVPKEYEKYIKYWDNYLTQYYKTTLKTGKSKNEKAKTDGDDS